VVDTLQDGVRFAALEREGNRVERPLVAALDGLIRLQQLGHGARAGIAPVPGAVDDAARATGAAFREAGKLALELAGPLQLDQAGLAERGRERLFPPALEARWREIASPAEGGGRAVAPASDPPLRDLITDLCGLIGHVGDTSNLILDPDLDSYYLIDVTLLALPQTLGRLATVQSFLASFEPEGAPTAAAGREASALARMLGEADRDRVLASLASALGEDRNFHGVSPTLADAVKAPLARFEASVGAVVGALAGLADGGGPPPADLLDRVGQARAATTALFDATVAELDVLLATRIADYQHRRALVVAAAAAAVLVAVAAFCVVAGGIVGRLRKLEGVMGRLAGGELECPIPTSTSGARWVPWRARWRASATTRSRPSGSSVRDGRASSGNWPRCASCRRPRRTSSGRRGLWQRPRRSGSRVAAPSPRRPRRPAPRRRRSPRRPRR
jgi:hypothetical protein